MMYVINKKKVQNINRKIKSNKKKKNQPKLDKVTAELFFIFTFAFSVLQNKQTVKGSTAQSTWKTKQKKSGFPFSTLPCTGHIPQKWPIPKV